MFLAEQPDISKIGDDKLKRQQVDVSRQFFYTYYVVLGRREA